ncbi:hypothetical protein SEMRO_2006_G310580.1 [Seminavis robusta]|uniref:Uncharacterized protein n=1 Tax=Seminavis robusta TaxID=568900 RepID=A0A9N8EXR0_9STRA|nr:hypothetical protein SEMRO_2006_G310580.1 [Seminavis robusta]|eukprot:Sro2006_g310580.1 n/a (145) ;mRNA; r:10082-10516
MMNPRAPRSLGAMMVDENRTVEQAAFLISNAQCFRTQLFNNLTPQESFLVAMNLDPDVLVEAVARRALSSGLTPEQAGRVTGAVWLSGQDAVTRHRVESGSLARTYTLRMVLEPKPIPPLPSLGSDDDDDEEDKENSKPRTKNV